MREEIRRSYIRNVFSHWLRPCSAIHIKRTQNLMNCFNQNRVYNTVFHAYAMPSHKRILLHCFSKLLWLFSFSDYDSRFYRYSHIHTLSHTHSRMYLHILVSWSTHVFYSFSRHNKYFYIYILHSTQLVKHSSSINIFQIFIYILHNLLNTFQE